MRFTCTFTMDNAEESLLQLLRQIQVVVKFQVPMNDKRPIRDSNGNYIGYWLIEGEAKCEHPSPALYKGGFMVCPKCDHIVGDE